MLSAEEVLKKWAEKKYPDRPIKKVTYRMEEGYDSGCSTCGYSLGSSCLLITFEETKEYYGRVINVTETYSLYDYNFGEFIQELAQLDKEDNEIKSSISN